MARSSRLSRKSPWFGVWWCIHVSLTGELRDQGKLKKLQFCLESHVRIPINRTGPIQSIRHPLPQISHSEKSRLLKAKMFLFLFSTWPFKRKLLLLVTVCCAVANLVTLHVNRGSGSLIYRAMGAWQKRTTFYDLQFHFHCLVNYS